MAPVTKQYTPDDQSTKDAKVWANSHPYGVLYGDELRPDFSPDSKRLLITGTEGGTSDAVAALGLYQDPGNH